MPAVGPGPHGAAGREKPADLVIRPATEADLGRIVDLLVRGAVPGTPESQEDQGALASYRAALAEIDAGEGMVFVAVRGGDVVGVCQLIVFRHLQRRGGRCAEIESVHVHPDHRGGGIGAALMEEAMARARALGCYRVQLTSNTVRADAHRFYERLGFEPSHVGFKRSLD